MEKATQPENPELGSPAPPEATPRPEAIRPVAGWEWAKWSAGGLALLLLVGYPLLNGQDIFGINLLTETLIFALFALSLNLLLGYTGLVSFGHATYFGMGAYTAGILTAQLKNPNLLLGLLLGLLVSALVALALGYLCIRTSGIYFLMLTLAFSQMFYAIAFKWSDVTGGSNGLPIPPVQLNLFGWQLADLSDPKIFYFLTLICFLLGFFLLRQLVQSPFGQTLVGIRENESRLSALGYNTRNFKLGAFVIAGGLGGVAGGLNAYHNNFVSANDFYWTTSGLVMVMVLLGGKGSLIGPVLGAFFVRYAEQFIQSQTGLKLGSFIVSERWQLVLGVVFVLFVLLIPNGLAGLGAGLINRVARRKA